MGLEPAPAAPPPTTEPSRAWRLADDLSDDDDPPAPKRASGYDATGVDHSAGHRVRRRYAGSEGAAPGVSSELKARGGVDGHESLALALGSSGARGCAGGGAVAPAVVRADDRDGWWRCQAFIVSMKF